MEPPLPLRIAVLAAGQLGHHAFGVHPAGEHVAVIAIAGNDLIALLERHLHADHHSLLPDIEVAEAADQAHAVHLPRLLFEAADQQHVAKSFEVLVFAELRHLCGRPIFCGDGHSCWRSLA